MTRFTLPLIAIVLLAVSCSTTRESNVSENAPQNELQETTTSVADTSPQPSLIQREVKKTSNSEPIVRFFTTVFNEYQSGEVVVPNFSRELWNNLGLAVEACANAFASKKYFDCSPAVGKLCFLAYIEVSNYKNSDNYQRDLYSAMYSTLLKFCRAANFAKNIELVGIMAYTHKKSLLEYEKFKPFVEQTRDALLRLSRNFEFYDIDTGHRDIEMILSLLEALGDYAVNFALGDHPATYYDKYFDSFTLSNSKVTTNENSRSTLSITDPAAITEFCFEAKYHAIARLENWESLMDQCLHFSDNNCQGSDTESIICKDVSSIAQIERLWQELPIKCLPDDNDTLTFPSETCRQATMNILEYIYRPRLLTDYHQDYRFASHEYGIYYTIYEILTMIIES